MSLAMLGCMVSRKRKPYPIFYDGNPRGVTFFKHDYYNTSDEDDLWEKITPTSPLWPNRNTGEPYITDRHIAMYAPHNGSAYTIAKTKTPLDLSLYSTLELAFTLGGVSATPSRPVHLRLGYSSTSPIDGGRVTDVHFLENTTQSFDSTGFYSATFDMSAINIIDYMLLSTGYYHAGQWFKITKWRLRR